MTEHLSIPTSAGDFDAIAAGPGDGRPVLLLHGFPQAAIAWEDQVVELGSAGFRAVAPDQRGYSRGVRPEHAAEYGLDQLVDDVLSMVETLGWHRFDLVGHDWGAVVAWRTAYHSPDRLRTLTVLSTPHPAAWAQAMRIDEDQQLRSGYLAEWRQAGVTERLMLNNNAAGLRRIFDGRVPQSRIEEYVRRLSEPGALTAALNWYRASRPDGRIGKVSVPTLYLWSTEDVAFGSTAALDTQNWVTGPYRFEMFEDISHWITDEASEAVTLLLLEHLSAH